MKTDTDPNPRRAPGVPRNRGHAHPGQRGSPPQAAASPASGLHASPAPVTAPPAAGALDLLERDAELAILQEMLDRARAGSGGLVVIEGPPGVGKSRLLAATRARARSAGMRVLVARGAELEREFAFGVALQLFGEPLQRAGAHERARLLSGPAGYASSLFDGGTSDDGGPSDERRAALITGLSWLAGNLVWSTADDEQLSPLLIAVDDAQWSDSGSLAFLAQLADRLPERPIGLAVAVRTGEPGARQALLDRLAVQPDASLLRPAPLSADGVARVIAAGLGAAPDPMFTRACAWATGGNPFLLGALVESLRSDRIRPTKQAASSVRELVPVQVLRSVTGRLGRLPADALALARAVAVLGDRAPLHRVATLAALETEAAERAADLLARARLLQGGEPLSFCHPLIASAVVEEMGTLAEARAHRHAADLLLADEAPDHEVAAHLLSTRPESDPHAVRVLRAAAQNALHGGESAGAVRLLRRALAEPPEVTQRPELLVELAHAEAASGDAGAPTRLDQAIELISVPGERARAMHGLSWQLWAQGEPRRAAQVAERALSELETDDPLREPVLTAYLAAAAFDPATRPRALELMGPIIERARAGELPSDRALIAQLALREAATGAPPRHVRTLAQAALADDPLIEPRSHGRALGFVAGALVEVDELELARDALEAALAQARQRGLLVAVGAARHWLANVHYRCGRLHEAITDAHSTLEIARGGWATYEGWSASILAHAQIETGELDAAREAVALGEAAPPQLVDRALVLEARGRLALVDGDPAAALAAFESSGAHLADSYDLWHPGIFSWRRAAALAAHQLGRRREAAEHLRVAERDARRAGVLRPIGEVQRVAGMIAGGTSGIALLREAVATLQRSPAQLEYARALVELGGALRRDGQRSAARGPLRQGLELADGFGARPLADTALSELRATGARPRRAALSGADALTATERRIASLAADGRTNPQIATALYVTTKTVEWHLGHIYAKLDISSRGQLPAALGAG